MILDKLLIRDARQEDIPIIIQEIYGFVDISKNIPSVFQTHHPLSYKEKGGIFSIPTPDEMVFLLNHGMVMVAELSNLTVACISSYTIDLLGDLSIPCDSQSAILHLEPLRSMEEVSGIGKITMQFHRDALEEMISAAHAENGKIFWGKDLIVLPQYQGHGIGRLVQIELYRRLLADYNCLYFLNEIYDIVSVMKNGQTLTECSDVLENKPSKRLHRDIMKKEEIGRKENVTKTIVTAQDRWDIEVSRSIWKYDLKRALSA